MLAVVLLETGPYFRTSKVNVVLITPVNHYRNGGLVEQVLSHLNYLVALMVNCVDDGPDDVDRVPASRNLGSGLHIQVIVNFFVLFQIEDIMLHQQESHYDVGLDSLQALQFENVFVVDVDAFLFLVVPYCFDVLFASFLKRHLQVPLLYQSQLKYRDFYIVDNRSHVR